MRDVLRTRQHRARVVLAVTFGVCALAAGQASAACMDNLLRLAAPKGLAAPVQPAPPARIRPAVYRPDTTARPNLQDAADVSTDEPIVGLWEFQVNGFPSDFGTQAWHSDGTELMFSGARNPATGDICQGVWRKIGPRTYSLNHIAMGWDAGSFGVRVHIHAVVTVDRSGDTFLGTLTASAYSVTPANPFDESAMIGSGGAAITGTRVKPD